MRIKIGNKLMKVNKNHPLVLIMEPGDEEMMTEWNQAPPGHRYFIFLTGGLDEDVLGEAIQDEIDDGEGEEEDPLECTCGATCVCGQICYQCEPHTHPDSCNHVKGCGCPVGSDCHHYDTSVEETPDCAAPPTKKIPRDVKYYEPEVFPFGSIYEGLCKMSKGARQDLQQTIRETEEK